MFSFLLTPLYTTEGIMDTAKYADVSIIFSWLVFFNVIFAYGMETSFFRFYNSEDKKQVLSTSTISLLWSSLFLLCLGLLFRNSLAHAAKIDVEFITYTVWVLALDALVIIPFSKLRVEGRPIYYAAIKIGSVALNVALNFFFLLWLPNIAKNNPDSFIATLYVKDFEVGYVFVANVISSLFAFIVLLPHYIKLKWHFNRVLWKRMMKYGLPVLVAGLAFAVNETFDRILLDFLNVSKDEIGAYSGCYRLAIFMTLFATAFRLGIEPFFFSHAKNENAPQTYAAITKFFVIFGSIILLCVIVFADVLKIILIRSESYWVAMKVVPLIILANFFLGIYHNLSVWYKLSDKTRIGAYISIVGAIVTLALNFILIPYISYYGSAIATLAAYSSMMLISFYFGNKYYPIPYDIKKISLYLGLSIVLSALSFYIDIFRQTYVFGILSIIAFFFIVYKNEKDTLRKILRKG